MRLKTCCDDRYARLRALDGFGDQGVERLGKAHVLVIGCGALGSMCAMQLAASGVGTIGIADFDVVELSNLQRQLFFTEADLGLPKCDVLAQRINALNSQITVNKYSAKVTPQQMLTLFADYDFIIDGTDSPDNKCATAQACRQLGKPCCIGGVEGLGGQVTTWVPGAKSYDELFGALPPRQGAALPVLGSAAVIVASTQAAEAIKYITGVGELLVNKLLVFDMALCQTMVYNV